MRKGPNLYHDTTEAKATSLYKALAKVVQKQDHAELARMIQLVLNSGQSFNRESTDLHRAFRWGSSPQGFGYWSALWNRVYVTTH